MIACDGFPCFSDLEDGRYRFSCALQYTEKYAPCFPVGSSDSALWGNRYIPCVRELVMQWRSVIMGCAILCVFAKLDTPATPEAETNQDAAGEPGVLQRSWQCSQQFVSCCELVRSSMLHLVL